MGDTTAVATKLSFFSPIGNTKPYFKAALQGFAGSGKTTTAALIARGLHKKIGSKKPIVMFDTERASKFLKPIFEKEGIEVVVKDSRSLADLVEAMRLMREGYSDILLIDSISHIWTNFIEAYKAKKEREKKSKYLTIADWGFLKPAWQTSFSDPFVNDPYHIIMCGRAGEVFSTEENEETGKKEMFVSGIKMKAEKETAYEPDMLVHMELVQDMEGRSLTRVVRTATVLKDRSALIDGKVFENPTFEHFEPVIDALLKDPKKKSTVAERDASELIKTEEEKREWRTQKEITLEQVENYLTMLWPSRSGEDNKNKIDAVNFAFGTLSWKAVEIMSLADIQKGWERIQEFGQKHIADKKKNAEDEKAGEAKSGKKK